MDSKKALIYYGYAFLILATVVFCYSAFRIVICPAGVQGDFGKLAGFAFWSFYGMPALILAAICLSLPKLTESRFAYFVMILIMALSTVRLIAAIFGV